MTHANKNKPVHNVTPSKLNTAREPLLTESEQSLGASETPNVQKYKPRAYEIL